MRDRLVALAALAWLAGAAAAGDPIPGTVFRDALRQGGEGPEMVVVPPGAFVMGSMSHEAGRDSGADSLSGLPDEAPPARLRMAHPFAVGRTEVTVADFDRFVRATGYVTDAERIGCYLWDGKLRHRPDVNWKHLPDHASGERWPVVCVSWNDARAYAGWLAESTGKSYRLPTEAEWEYAARAGTRGARFWGDDPHRACTWANVADRALTARMPRVALQHDCDDGHFQAAPTASFDPNPFGLYDVLGNVWEWTCSRYQRPYKGARLRCAQADDTSPRVMRGGGWYTGPSGVRAAHRNAGGRDSAGVAIGFRVVRDL